MKFLAKTLFGLEDILERELRDLGASDISKGNRAVTFHGDLEMLYKVNYCSRYALRILYPIHSFEATNEQQVYDFVKAFNWNQYLDNSKTFMIDATVQSGLFKHSQYIALKTKDAIADRFRETTGRRPSVDKEQADIRINLYVNGKDFIISLDSSGAPLNQRGYRKQGFSAPLNEVLAAALVRFSGWDKKSPLVDPMCGSGTLLTEAAMMAANVPSGFYRSQFAFMNWPNFQANVWRRVKAEARKEINAIQPELYGMDKDQRIIDYNRDNSMEFKKIPAITYKHQGLVDLKPPAESGFLISNPPYGERIEQDIEMLYKNLGSVLKDRFTGWRASVFSGNLEALGYLGLRASNKKTLYNGAIKCRIQNYELF